MSKTSVHQQQLLYQGARYKIAAPVRWGLKPSKGNPGYYQINIPNLAALATLGKAFPDMLDATWLAEQVQAGPVTESLGLKMYKDGDDHWVGWSWWEDEGQGVDIHVRRVVDNYQDWTGQLNFEIRPQGAGYSQRWEISKPIQGKRTYLSINTKAEAAWALKRYLDQL